MNVAVLVPYRPHPTLAPLWETIESWWHHHHAGWPVHVADSTGSWSRAEAINRAAHNAGDWEVAVIADVCVWQRPETTIRHTKHTHRYGGMTVPYEACIRLNPQGSEAFTTAAGTGEFIGWNTDRVDDVRQPHGGLSIIHRDTWNRVGGMDPRFRVWGGEDDALLVSARTLDKTRRGDGVLWQLHHEPMPRDTNQRPQRLARRYLKADGNPKKIRALIRERQ